MIECRRRAQALLEKMTLTEKVGQLAQQYWGFNAYTRDENGEIILTEDFKKYVLRFGGIGKLYGYFRADPWSRRGYSTGVVTADGCAVYKKYELYPHTLTLMLGNASNDIIWKEKVEVK